MPADSVEHDVLLQPLLPTDLSHPGAQKGRVSGIHWFGFTSGNAGWTGGDAPTSTRRPAIASGTRA